MTVKEHLVDQFREPRGPLGRLAGHIMASRNSNAERNRRTVELLQPDSHDHVLEVGYGPGLAVTHLAELVPFGSVTGIDHSATMCSVASRRVDSAGLSDRVEVLVADVTDLGDSIPGPFDRVLAVNVWMFWPEQVAVLGALRDRMSPGGRLCVTYQPRHSGATAKDTQLGTEKLLEQAAGAGYVGITTETIALDDVPAVVLVAHAPPTQ